MSYNNVCTACKRPTRRVCAGGPDGPVPELQRWRAEAEHNPETKASGGPNDPLRNQQRSCKISKLKLFSFKLFSQESIYLIYSPPMADLFAVTVTLKPSLLRRADSNTQHRIAYKECLALLEENCIIHRLVTGITKQGNVHFHGTISKLIKETDRRMQFRFDHMTKKHYCLGWVCLKPVTDKEKWNTYLDKNVAECTDYLKPNLIVDYNNKSRVVSVYDQLKTWESYCLERQRRAVEEEALIQSLLPFADGV